MFQVTRSSFMLHAEKMRPEDFKFAIQLTNTMDWKMAKADFQFMLKLEPDGCFILFDDTERVGIATCIGYGKKGWFGNLAIKEDHRKKGAGTTLVKTAVDYLRGKGVETVGLYAYRHLVRFYEKLGFKAHDDFVVLNGKPSLSKPLGLLKKANKRDIPAVIDFDRRCFGWERKKLIELLLLAEGNFGYLSIHNGEVTGFAAAKVYDEMAEIGPVVCSQEHSDIAGELLRTMLNNLRNRNVNVYVPHEAKPLLTTLLDGGLKEKFHVKRMFLGSVSAQSCVYLPESLERG